MGWENVSSEGPSMWERGFEETPLLLIPREERNRAEGGGSSASVQVRGRTAVPGGVF